MRRSFVPFAVAAALLTLLAVLGTLQYRWLGEVSNAERERLRTTLRTRATDFSRDFDREITRAYLAFRANPDLFGGEPAKVLADAYARAQAESAIGGIIEAVYFLDFDDSRSATLSRLDPLARTLTAVEWPPEFEMWRHRVLNTSGAALPPLFPGDAIDARIPALYVTLPPVRRLVSGDHVAIVHENDAPTRAAILKLDRNRVEHQLLEALVARHFGADDASEYFVSIVTREPVPRIVFASSADAGLTAANADVAIAMFDLRVEELQTITANTLPPTGPSGQSAPQIKDRVAVTIVRRSDSANAGRVVMVAAEAQGAWQALVRGKAGSLESLVARSRRRNLAVGLGILGLLAASLVFVVGSAQRQRRLAMQQMEFVAAVSHELRTPLAVIRSAGENLADGVVADTEQVRTYGSLIRNEGRRLSDMVERVMEFAGMTAAVPMRTHEDVDVAGLVGAAVESIAPDARERNVSVAVRAASGLPAIVGDPDALRSAIQNVVANAVKYSPAGGAVDVQADCDGGRVRVTVSDRGIGIDAADLPHVFKPFYRGRRALDAQIRGTGVGLSVVRRVVDAHHGEVTIESRAAEGTRVVLSLPASPRRDGYVGDRAAAGVTT